MPSRKDQLHSYQFMMQRVISSIMLHETDPEQTPLRRGVGALFGGLMVAALVAAGFGIYGVITGVEAGRWRTDGAIIIERETGAHFVYRQGVLQPVLNYASARLVSGVEAPPLHRVASRSLAGLPRAVVVGIPGAPESLPPPARAVGPPWTMCSTLEVDDTGAPATSTTLLVGGEVPGGVPFEEHGLVVRDPADDTRYLVWRSHRYRITGDDPDRVIRSLYGFHVPVVDVGTAWLNGVPAGPDLGPPDVEGVRRWGKKSTGVSGYRVGDLVHHPIAGGAQHYLVLDDGLAPVTELQMMLLRAEHDVELQEIPSATANRLRHDDRLVPVEGEAAPPSSPPPLLPVPPDGLVTLCATTTSAATPPALSLGGDLSVLAAALPTARATEEGTRLADRVMVPPGRVAVVRAVPSGTAEAGSYQVVTDVGVRYPVSSPEALAALGYPPDMAVDIPAALVQRIPVGPTLDFGAAMQPAPVGGTVE